MDNEALLAALAILSTILIISSMTTAPSALITGTVSLELPGNVSSMNLTLNGINGDITIDAGSNVTIFVELSVPGGNITLDVNMTGWSILTNTTPLYKVVVFPDAGTYNVTAWFPGDLNNTAVSVTHYITVRSITPPIPPTPPGGGGPGGGSGPTPNITLPVKYLKVIVLSDIKVLIIGANLDPGLYFADTSGAAKLSLYGLSFNLGKNTDNMTIIIEAIPKPANLTGIEQDYRGRLAYQYLNVTVTGADPKKSFRTISFMLRVTKEWADDNYVSPGSITLYMYGSWKQVSTVKMAEGDGYHLFLARDMPALSSYYAVAGESGPPGFPLNITSQSAPVYMQLAIFALAISLLLLMAGRIKPRKKKQPVESKPISTQPRELYSTWAYSEQKAEKEEKKEKRR